MRHRTKLVMGSILRDLRLQPGHITAGVARQIFYPKGRVVSQPTVIERKLHRRMYGLQPVANGKTLLGLLVEHRHHVLALQHPYSLVAVFPAEVDQDIAA